MGRPDIVIYVEDPGAANFVSELPDAIARLGSSVILLADGKAAEQLRALGGKFEFVDGGAEAVARRVSDLRPGVIAVGTSENVDSPGLALVDFAGRAGIVSVGLVDGPSNADHRFRGRTGEPLGHAPDWIVVADEAVRSQFVAFGMPDERVLVGGHPRYDAVLRQGERLAHCDRGALRERHFSGIGTDGRVVVFLSELSDGVNPQQYHRMPEYTLRGRGDVDGRTEIVLEEVLDALALVPRKPRLIVRLHPKSTQAEFEAWSSEIDGFSERGDTDNLLEMLYAADLVVGLSTMLMMEAALAGCRTLSVLPRKAETAWLPSIALGLTPCVADREALCQALRLALADQAPALADPAQAVLPGAVDRVAGILAGLTGVGAPVEVSEGR